MAVRTTDELVRGIIDTDADTPVEPFITMANALADFVSSKDDQGLLTASLLTSIETCLAAHFYARRDPQYRARTTEGAQAQFQGVSSGPRLESTDWGQDAMVLDVTGTLSQLNAGRRQARLNWLGYAPSDQTTYTDRD